MSWVDVENGKVLNLILFALLKFSNFPFFCFKLLIQELNFQIHVAIIIAHNIQFVLKNCSQDIKWKSLLFKGTGSLAVGVNSPS